MNDKNKGMSESYQKVEAENQKAANEKAQEEVNAKEVIFWAPATRYQIANFQREERSGGHITQGEEPLQFRNHMYITIDPVMIEFIEKSSGFRNGQVKRCKDMAEAQIFTSGVKARRQKKDYDITSGGPDGHTGDKIQKVVGA